MLWSAPDFYVDAATEEGKFETKAAARAAMHSMAKWRH
jgi:hypothetical protein